MDVLYCPSNKGICSNVIAIALSGGVDSLSLTYLTRKWSIRLGVDIAALIVNHNLRLETHEETCKIIPLVRSWGVSVDLVHIDYGFFLKSKSFQDDFRLERYNMIAKVCNNRGIRNLLVGHHLEDQAETCLMRYMKGSGILGLKGMSPSVPFSGIRLVRPLIFVPKVRLRSILPQSTCWVEDTSNYSRKYIRNNIRNFMKSNLNVNSTNISKSSVKFEKIDKFLEKHAEVTFKKFVYVSLYGYALMSISIFKKTESVILESVISNIIKTCSGSCYYPRYKAILGLIGKLKKPKFSGINCSGCLVSPYKGKILFTREWDMAEKTLLDSTLKKIVWDGRFSITGIPGFPKGSVLESLGNDGIKELNRMKIGVDYLTCPSCVKRGLPCVRFKNTLISVPHIKSLFYGKIVFNFKVSYDFFSK